MPLCRSLGGGLWELRSNLSSRRIARLIFFIEDGEIYIVHGFIKKTQKTPDEDIALAARRLKETMQ
jgi:phage-related protein